MSRKEFDIPHGKYLHFDANFPLLSLFLIPKSPEKHIQTHENPILFSAFKKTSVLFQARYNQDVRASCSRMLRIHGLFGADQRDGGQPG